MKKLIIFYLILIIAFFALEIILSNLFKDCSLENTQFASIKEYYLDIHSKFFVKIIKNNEEVYTPQRAMADAAKTFLANKPSDVIRIFIVGGSVALQFNNDFEDQLKQFIPNKNIELINCAVGGYDSFRTYLVEKEILNYDPDLIIVFSGNNEFYDRNGFNVNAYHLARFLNKSFILRTLHKYLKNILNYENKGFIRDYQTRLFDYQKNIRKIICASRKRKVPILFATLPFNMRDLAPKVYSDEHSKQLLLGTYLLWHDDYENALNEFNKEKDKRDPLLFFYLGETYYGLKQFEKAKECYLKSNELAARSDWTNATFASNNIIRKVSLEEGVPYVDLEKLFINASPEGIIGMELLFDNCHWWDDIQPYVNKTIICNILKDKDRLLPHFVFNDYKINQRQPIEIKYSFEERRDNKEIVNDQSLNSVFFALYEPINSHRPEYLFKNLYFLDPSRLSEIKFIREKYENIYREDPTLKLYLAEENIIEKNWSNVLYFVGKTFMKLKLYEESLEYFNKTIEQDKDNYLPYLGIALINFELGNKDNARKYIGMAENLSDNDEINIYKEILGL